MKKNMYFSIIIAIIINLFFNLEVAKAEKKIVTNSEELTNALKDSAISEILLTNGMYKGNFLIDRNNITIQPASYNDKDINFNHLDKDGAIISIKETLFPVKNISIKGINFKSTDGGYAIESNYAENVNLSELTIDGFADGIFITAFNDKITNCKFINNLNSIRVDNREIWPGNLNISDNNFNENYRRIDLNLNKFEESIDDTVHELQKNIVKEMQISEKIDSGIDLDENDKILAEASDAFIKNDYLKSTILSQRYLQKICTSKELIVNNIKSIIYALNILILPPNIFWEENDYYGISNFKRNDLQLELGKNNDVYNNIALPAFYKSNDKSLSFNLITEKLIIDGKSIISSIPILQSIKVDIFRKNIELYKQFRKNITDSKKIISEILTILKNDQTIPVTLVEEFNDFSINSSKLIALSDNP